MYSTSFVLDAGDYIVTVFAKLSVSWQREAH